MRSLGTKSARFWTPVSARVLPISVFDTRRPVRELAETAAVHSSAERSSTLKAAELILDVLLDVALLLRGGIDRAMGIDGNAFRRLQFRVGHRRRRDVGRDLPVFHAANADAHLAVAIVVRTLLVVRGLGVDRIKHVILI